MGQDSKKGEFFPVSVQAIDQIAAQGGMADDVLGYVVLARHASVNVPDRRGRARRGVCRPPESPA